MWRQSISATRGSQHIPLEMFNDGPKKQGRTLILLDEVPIILAVVAKVSEDRRGFLDDTVDNSSL